MKQDQRLLQALLVKLKEIEAAMSQGDVKLVQPPVEGLHVPNPLTVPGYDGKQIESHLKLLVQKGWIDTGGVDDPMIGIHFSHLTDAGHRAMGQAR